MGLLIFYLILAIGFSFICSVLEAVILSVTPSFVRIQIQQGKKGATRLKSLKENIDRPLSAILTLNTIAHTIGAAGVGAQAVAVFGEVYFGLISAVLTILILVLSEVIPKTVGARYWRQLALPAARLIKVLIFILYPLVLVSELLTNMIIRKKKTQSITRDEIEALTSLGTKEGVFENEEGKLINNVLQLRNIRVKDIMTPRTVVKAAQEDMTLVDFLSEDDFKQFSRIPLYTESLDTCNSFVLKVDVLQKIIEGHGEMLLKEVKRPVIIVPENLLIHKLFDKLLQKHDHIALVVDEYGGFEGVVTIEDIIETILGLEIRDETDSYLDMQKLAREKWKIKAKKLKLGFDED
jgi:CBS domain containing-hemolysin-like protein